MCTLAYTPHKYECGHYLYTYVYTIPCEPASDTLAYCFTPDCGIEYLAEVHRTGTCISC